MRVSGKPIEVLIDDDEEEFATPAEVRRSGDVSIQESQSLLTPPASPEVATPDASTPEAATPEVASRSTQGASVMTNSTTKSSRLLLK